MTIRLPLPDVLNGRVAPALRDALLTLRGEDLELDGAAVERLAAPGLQVLLSARETWAADGRSFRLLAPSDALRSSLALFGAHALLAA